jgi:hypothetical protein
MKLPDDHFLAYVVPHEAWYRAVTLNDPPSIQVMAASSHGGVAWEFIIEKQDINPSWPALRLQMFDEAWDAFGQVPELFTALELRRPRSLPALRAMLDELGARDITERKKPKAASAAPERLNDG